MNKIKHDYKCEICGKVAVITMEDNWTTFRIDDSGEFYNKDEYGGNNNHFYCKECAENEGLM